MAATSEKLKEKIFALRKRLIAHTPIAACEYDTYGLVDEIFSSELDFHTVSRLLNLLIFCGHKPLETENASGCNFYPESEDGKYSPEEYIRYLRTHSRKKLCGYVFKKGDLAYNCAQCQRDPTSVLCRECYENSDHVGHDVTFHKAGEGGCCDCGDAEAWDGDNFCTRHGERSNTEEQDLSEEVKTQAKLVFWQMTLIIAKAVADVFYSYVRTLKDSELITLYKQDVVEMMRKLQRKEQEPSESSDELTTALFLQQSLALDSKGPFYVLLNNDDVNTYDDVTNALRQPPFSFPIQKASQLTRQVDTEGRAPVYESGKFDHSEVHQSLHEARVRSCALREKYDCFLLASICFRSQLQLEQAAVHCFQYFTELFSISDELGRLGTETITKKVSAEWYVTSKIAALCYMRYRTQPYRFDSYESCDVTEPVTSHLLTDMVRYNSLLPKGLNKVFHEFSVRALVEYDFRLAVTEVFCETYCDTCIAYAVGLGTKSETFLHQGVQLITVPSAIQHCNKQRSVLSIFCKSLACFYALCKKVDGVQLDPDSSGIRYSRYWFFLMNILYYIRVVPSPFFRMIHSCPPCLKYEVIDSFLSVLEYGQTFHICRRHQGSEHVIHEDEHVQIYFNFNVEHCSVIKEAAVSISQDMLVGPDGEQRRAHDLREVVRGFFEMVLQKASLCYDRINLPHVMGPVPVSDMEFSTKHFYLLKADMYKGDGFSFHLPLQRFFALILHHLGKSPSLSSPTVYKDIFCVQELPRLLELLSPVFRTVAGSMQIMALMWRRNGTLIFNQASYYFTGVAAYYFLWDIYALQIMLCLYDYDFMLMTLLKVSGLLHIFSPSDFKDSENQEKEQYIPALLEEMLYLFATLLNEIPLAMSDKESAEHDLKQAVIHKLALGPSSYSAINMFVELSKHKKPAGIKFSDVLKEVSDLELGNYVLKKKYWAFVDPAYFAYSRANRDDVIVAKSSIYTSGKETSRKAWTLAKTSEATLCLSFEKCSSFFVSEAYLYCFLRPVLVGGLVNTLAAQSTSSTTGVFMITNDSYRRVETSTESKENNVLNSRVTPSVFNSALYVLTKSFRLADQDSEKRRQLVQQLQRRPLGATAERCTTAPVECMTMLEVLLTMLLNVSRSADNMAMVAAGQYMIERLLAYDESLHFLSSIFDSDSKANQSKKIKTKHKKSKGKRLQELALKRMKEQAGVFLEYNADLAIESVEQEEAADNDYLCGLCKSHTAVNKDLGYLVHLQSSTWGKPLSNLNVYERQPCELLKIQRKYAGCRNASDKKKKPGNRTAILLSSFMDGSVVADAGNIGGSELFAELLRQNYSMMSSEEETITDTVEWGFSALTTSSRPKADDQSDQATPWTEFMKETVHGLDSERHLSFCQHTVHQTCLETYENFRGMESRHVVQFQTKCPICRTYSNVLMPVCDQESGFPVFTVLLETFNHQQGLEGKTSPLFLCSNRSAADETQPAESENQTGGADIEEEFKKRFEQFIRVAIGIQDQLIMHFGIKTKLTQVVSFARIIGYTLRGMKQSTPLDAQQSSSTTQDLSGKMKSCYQNLIASLLTLKRIRDPKFDFSAFAQNLASGTFSAPVWSYDEVNHSDIYVLCCQVLSLLVTGEVSQATEQDHPHAKSTIGPLNSLFSVFSEGDYGCERYVTKTKTLRSELPYVHLYQKGFVEKLTVKSEYLFSRTNPNEDEYKLAFVLGFSRFEDSIIFKKLNGSLVDGKQFGCGIEKGDFLLKVSGESIVGKSLEEVKKVFLKQVESEVVSLEVIRYARKGSLLDVKEFDSLFLLTLLVLPPKELPVVIRTLTLALLVSKMITTVRRANDRYDLVGEMDSIDVDGSSVDWSLVEKQKEKLSSLWRFVVSEAYPEIAGVSFTSSLTQVHVYDILYRSVTGFLSQIGLILSLLPGMEQFSIPAEGTDFEAFWMAFKLPSFDTLATDLETREVITQWIKAWRRLNPSAAPKCTRSNMGEKKEANEDEKVVRRDENDAIRSKLSEVARSSTSLRSTYLLDCSATQLIKLPERYDTLYNVIKEQSRCPVTKERIEHPALCLRCGVVVCSKTRCCSSQLKPSTFVHFQTSCRAPFLMINVCKVLLLSSPIELRLRKVFALVEAPYVDDHNETDPGLRRGRALTLDRKRYAELERKCSTLKLDSWVFREESNRNQRQGTDQLL